MRYRATAVFLFLALLTGLLFPGAAWANDNSTEKIDESKYQPLLVIERVTADEAVVGGEFYVSLVIKNQSDYPAFNVVANISIPGEEEIFFLRPDSPSVEDPDLQKIEAWETRNLTFPVQVTENAREGYIYRTTVTVEGQNVFFNPAPRATAMLNLEVGSGNRMPRLTVEEVSLTPAEPGYREPFQASFTIVNRGDAPARELSVAIEGGAGGQESFQVTDITNRKFVQDISPGGRRRVTFNLKELEEGGDNRVTLTLTYRYPGGKEASEKIVVNLPLELEADAGSQPQLTISSYELAGGEGPGEYNLKLLLENKGQQAAENIRLALEGEGLYVLGSSNVDYLSLLEGESKKELTYAIGIEKNRDASHLPLTVSLTFQNEEGEDRPEVKETLGISLERLGLSSPAGEPRVLINKYTLSEKEIQGGSSFTLTLFIENTFHRPVQNVRVSFEPIKLEESDGTTRTGGTVFSPVEGSNSFYLERIPARTTVQRSVNYYVDPNAAARTYIMPVTIDYEDEEARGYKVEETVNVPVTQESRFQILSVETPPTAFVGEPLFISAEFVNVGKVALGNMIVMMEGDFPKEQASYFVGNLEIGQSDFYQGIIYPQQEGLLEGELVFSYIDHHNQEVQVREPFQVQVEGRPMGKEGPEGMPPEMDYPGQPGGSRTKTFLLVGLVVVAAAAVFFFLRRRARRKAEEEFLDA